MQRYDTYKPSGVKWLGEIPSHWEVIKTSHLFTHIGSGTTPKSGSEEYYTEDGIPFLQTGDLNDGFIVDTSKKITEKALRDTNLTIYLQGSLVIAMYGATIGKLGILGIDTTVNQACCVLPKSPKVETRFAFYAYLAAKNDLIFQSKGGGQLNISQDTIKNERIPVPSRAEQTAIANYLDTATAKIDAAIAQQQKMIDLLNERKQIIINRAVTKGLNPNAKMKDSGVEWIGEVPEGWEVKKLKHLAKIFGRIGFRGYNASDLVDEGEGAITLSPSNMKEHKMQYEKCTYLSWDKYFESPEIMIKNGDVLFVKTGSTYGKSCLVENLPMEATINPQLVVFKEFNCSNIFFEYLLQSNIIRDQVELSVIGGTIPTISQEKILNYIVPIPSMEEQSIIVDAINSRCNPLYEAINNANKKISLLQERKQIIINEVVTGKVKVG